MATTTKTEPTQTDLLKLVRYAAENADVASSKRERSPVPAEGLLAGGPQDLRDCL